MLTEVQTLETPLTMKQIRFVVLASIVLALRQVANANPNMPPAGDIASISEWERTALYEPCINGDVSASRLYPSQIAEDKSFMTLGMLAQ